MNLLTTAQAAARLGVSIRRVQALAATGQLESKRVGRDWLFDSESVEAFAKIERPPGWKPGRPRK